MKNFQLQLKNEYQNFVTLTSVDTLKKQNFQRRIWIAFRSIDLSRRQWPDELCRAIYEFDGVILRPDGRPWLIPHIDELMGDPRWISMYKETKPDGTPRRKVRALIKLQIIDLYFQITSPEIQRHFAR